MAAKKPAGPQGGMAGTPLPAKLGIKEGSVIVLVAPPSGFADMLGELPVGTRLDVEPSAAKRRSPGRGKARPDAPGVDVAVLFVTERAAMNDVFATTTPRMTPQGGVWIAWPKKASGVATDITENAIREDLLPTGWVDNKVCAIDETWSGLRMVLRKELRPKGK